MTISKRVLMQHCIAFLLGIILIRMSFAAGYVIIIVAMVLLELYLWKKKQQDFSSIGIRFFYAFSLIISFVIGMMISMNAIHKQEAIQKTLLQQSDVMISGKLYKKDKKKNQYLYYVKTANLIQEQQEIPISSCILYPNSDDIPLGSFIIAKGQLTLPQTARNEGAFDEASYLASQGIYSKIKNTDILKIYPSNIVWREELYQYRLNMKAFYKKNLYGEETEILSAMTLGEKSDMGMETKDLFSMSGLSHILAISGLHISIIGMSLWKLFRRLKLPFLLSGILSGTMVIVYGIFTGNSISTVRAVGMFLMMLIAQILGEAYDLLTGLSMMAILILLYQPMAISDASFVLSFFAVAGVASVALPIKASYERVARLRFERKMVLMNIQIEYVPSAIERFISAYLTSFFISLATIPMIAYYFYVIPIYIVFLNMILLPFLGLLLGCGLLAGVLHFPILLYPCHCFIYFYEAMASLSLHLPFARLTIGRLNMVEMIVYEALLLLIVWLICRDTDKLDCFLQQLNWVSYRRLLQMIAVSRRKLYCKVGIVMGCMLLVIYPYPDKHFEIDMLDVGQGDGIYIQGDQGESYFIDGGSTSQTNIGKYTLLPFLQSRGIAKVDYWFLTHSDADHINGCMEVLSYNYPVQHVILSSAARDNKAFDSLRLLLKEKQIPLYYMDRGDSLSNKSLKLTCIYPDEVRKREGTNENSMVLYLQYDDFDAIFTGDVDEIGEKQILSDPWSATFGINHRQIDLLKAAHHGSNNSNCLEWLQQINPSLVLISAGRNNIYHHPGRQMLLRLKDCHISSLCTKDTGEIRILYQKDKKKMVLHVKNGYNNNRFLQEGSL